MRTTLNLPPELLVQAKTVAARRRTTVTALVEAGLRRVLKEPEVQADFKLELPVFGGTPGLVSDIDLGSNRAMLDRCDEPS